MSTEEVYLFVVLKKKQQAALDTCHRELGHQGRDRTLSLMRERFWWPKMRTQVIMQLRGCKMCTRFEAKPAKPLLVPIVATEPMDLVHIDFVKMELTNNMKETAETCNVLVVVDHFTRYVQAFVTPNQTAQTTAKALFHIYFSIFGFPRRLMSDQAKAFEGKVIKNLCDYLGVEKIRTTAYHPQSNGQVERIHQTLMRMVCKLDTDRTANWPSHLGAITHAYNSTGSLVTGYSPY